MVTLTSHAAAAVALAGFTGTILGSFLSTLALRTLNGRSEAGGRSRCDRCGAQLRWFELVPILSAAIQRGRCRRCAAPIHPAHAATEIAAALIAGLAAALWVGDYWSGEAALAWAGFSLLLIPVAITDLLRFRLPGLLVVPIALAGLVAGSGMGVPLIDRVAGGVTGWLLLELVAVGWRAATGRAGLGGGDARLFGAIGLWLGWLALPWLLVGASLAGFAWLAGMRLRRGRMPRRVPLGAMMVPPAIMLGALAAAQTG